MYAALNESLLAMMNLNNNNNNNNSNNNNNNNLYTDFWQVGISYHALSEHYNKSHNFPNSNTCDVKL